MATAFWEIILDNPNCSFDVYPVVLFLTNEFEIVFGVKTWQIDRLLSAPTTVAKKEN
ncbi:MAG: hypothetical protein KF851_01300 [Pirellulaceae bacterium]|nr:hypothetical protein [Pirellulaceae bacterium]